MSDGQVTLEFTEQDMAKIEAEAKAINQSVEVYCEDAVLDTLDGDEPSKPTLKPRQPRGNTIEGKTLSYKQLKGGFDYSQCKINCLWDKIPEDIGIFDSVLTGPSPDGYAGDSPHNNYINCGLSDKDWNLWLVRVEFQPSGERGSEEFKVSGVNAHGCGTAKGKLRLRLRHGSKHVWADCTDVEEVTVRDGLHKFHNLHKAYIKFYEGNLPWHAMERNKKPGWIKLRNSQPAGQRMYSSGESSVTGAVGRIEIGARSKNGGEYPAVNHTVAKALRSVTKLGNDGNTTKFV